MSGFQVSPGVQVNEIDLTNVIPAVSSSVGGFAGDFAWGPVEQLTLVSSEKELVNQFGKPSVDDASSFLSAAFFLNYSSALRVVRAVDANAFNANTDATESTTLIKNTEDYDSKDGTFGGEFAAKYPGVLGNALAIQVCTNATAFDSWQYANQFTSAPGTSDYAAARSGSDDELHVVVVDVTGDITGTAGTILETFGFLSQARDAKGSDGTSLFYKDVLNRSSAYVWFLNHDAALVEGGSFADSTTFTTSDTILGYTFSNGTDSTDATAAVTSAYDLFADSETVDISLLFQGTSATTVDATTLSQKLVTIADARKDCVAFISPPIEATVGTLTPKADVIAWANGITSTSYAFIDSTAIKVYDRYNDQFVWIQGAGSVAGLCANTDDVADPWFSPAGFNRGQLRSVVKLAFNPTKAERDDLYQARVNPLVSFPGEGTVLYGDKTALSKPSAFDRINVRRLFIVMEKAISTAAKFQLFEQNDAFTRAQFRNLVEPYLRAVQGRRGITAFEVVCDDTNNDGQVIDSNSFVADIYVRPTRSINYINLNFIATRTGVEFAEIVGQ